MKKKIIAAALSAVLASSALITMVSAAPLMGDLNDDGKVNASDARTALRIAAKLETISDDKLVLADTNSDGKITAADARAILRVAAKLDTFPEITTQAPETTTEAPETTTQAPETTTEAPETTTESETGVITSDYPAVIDEFFSGRFYIDGVMHSGENSEIELKLATNGKSTEISANLEGKLISIYSKDAKAYIKWIDKNSKKWYLDTDKMMGETGGEGFGDLFKDVNFATDGDYADPVLTHETVDGIKYDVYTFGKSASDGIVFYALGDKITKIQLPGETESKYITVNELTGDIPQGMLSLSGYNEGSLLVLASYLGVTL